jgi:Zn-dependent protease
VDLVGSIIVPATLAIAGAPIFGWAKPVPVRPDRFAEPRRGMALVSVAGPLTNLGLAAVSLASLRLLEAVAPHTRDVALMSLEGGAHQPIGLSWAMSTFLVAMLLINMILGVFNLLPIPPLDGAGIVSGFLPEPVAQRYGQLGKIGFFLIVVLLWIGAFDVVFRPFMILIFKLIAG